LFAPQRIINRFMWYSARIIIVVTGIYYTVSAFITTFACSPREAIWNPLITDATCLDNNLLVLITCLFNILSDILILVLPARAVWKLRISTKRKITIVLLFAVGLLACIANAMIILYVIRLGETNADVSYNSAWQGLWAIAELSLGIIVICTFSLPRFFEARGTMLRNALSSLLQPFTSLRSGTGLSFRTRTQSQNDSAGSRGTRPGRATINVPSESDLPLNNRDSDIESHPSYEGAHDLAKYPRANATDVSDRH